MKHGPKVDVVSLGVSQVSRVGNLKRITFEANLQMTKPGEGAVEATHTNDIFPSLKKMEHGISKAFTKIILMINN